MSNLYEVAILLKPTRAEAKDGEKPKLVSGIWPVIADSTESAKTIALRSDELDGLDPERLTVLVRLFQ